MRLDAATDKLHIDLGEFVALARRGISEHVSTDDAEPHRDARTAALAKVHFGTDARFTITEEVAADGYTFVLHAHADGRDGASLSVLCLCDTSVKHPPKALVAQVRAEGYITAHLLALREGYDAVSLHMLYLNPDTDEQRAVDEHLTCKTLRTFFAKCLKSVCVYAAPAVERVTRRLPSLVKLPFPYAHVREGQHEFIRAVHRTVARGGRLCAEAPTGIGKTVSTLYPALRAMGEGACDKIFYLTPKTTTVEAVQSCLCDLAEVGADVRAVSVVAKERLCRRGTVCRQSRDACPLLKNNRLADAALALYREGHTLVGREQLHRTADAFRVCPYELSLCYAELCDVVVCDFNYLFDPTVYLRRFFDTGGRYAFLIDEAHNLPDRAREMYSQSITADELAPLSYDFGEHNVLRPIMEQAKTQFCELLFAFLKDDMRKNAQGDPVGFAHGRALPQALFDLFFALLPAAEEEVFQALRDKSEQGDAHRQAARAYYYRIKGVTEALARFDRTHEWFMQLQDGILSLKLFCVDPSVIIGERLGRGHSAVLFSATLSPIEYYRSLFGFERGDEVLSVESPFDPDRLCISVMDAISIRYSERERTMGAVLRTLAAAISPHRGHYMVFSPSFAYNDALYDAFVKRYPNVRAIKQTPSMTDRQKGEFLAAFAEEDPSYLVAFCVMGGIYSEGIDLCGDKLIGAILIGVGMPGVSAERESICAYYDERSDAGKAYAYMYPGLNKVLQAAGRVIRTEQDRGVLVLIDDRLADPAYKRSIPKRFHTLKFVSDPKALHHRISAFWSSEAAPKASADAQKGH